MAGQAEGIWQEEIRIHSYDVDFTQNATLEVLCRLFLEAAWNHAEALGVGFARLAEQNRLWVLARLLIKLGKYPRWGEQVSLNTWPRAGTGLFALREFELLDNHGHVLGGGSSAWVVLDARTKRPQRIEKMLSAIRVGPERLAVGREPSKVPPCPGTAAVTTKANYSDIDLNGHLNSGRYIGWLLDSYPLEFHARHQAELLEINYLEEVKGGETLSVRSREESPGSWSHAMEKSDGTEVCRARIVWSPRSSVAA